MADAKPAVEMAIPAVQALPQGIPFSFYERGVDAYEKLRVNGAVSLKLDDGSTYDGTVQSMQVGPLIDLLMNFGPQSVYTAGRIYTPLTLIQALTDAAGGEVLDVTKLFTVIVVTAAPKPAA